MDIVTLIPAFKPQYMGELFLGLANQTLPSKRIVVSDDSPDSEFSRLLDSAEMAPLRERLPVEIIRGPRKGAYANFEYLLDHWSGSSELVHLLLDDDVLYPEFYELHRLSHESARFSSSVSARWYANENGQPISVMPVPGQVRFNPARFLSLGPDMLFKTTVPHCNNWLGEFSNCVMTAETAKLARESVLAGISYAGLWDVGTLLAASLAAPVAYLQDRLGYFRVSRHQQSANFQRKDLKAGHLAWVALALAGRRMDQLNVEDVQSCCRNITALLSKRYAQEEDISPFLTILSRLAAGMDAVDDFLATWGAFFETP